MESIPGTPYIWTELRQAAHGEGVVHLDDLLLRRVRLGLIVPNGGLDQMNRIRSIVQPELGWEDARWQVEEKNYSELWHASYHFG
jgi:glycerol-3-phosphate dehydrogenase